MHDHPHAALAGGGDVTVAGWVLARLDLRLPIEEPYGRDASLGLRRSAPDRAWRPRNRSSGSTTLSRPSARSTRGSSATATTRGAARSAGPAAGTSSLLVEAEALDALDLSWEAGAAQRRHARHLAQRARRPAVQDRLGRVRGAEAGRALRTPREVDAPRDPAAARAPRRTAGRRHPRRRLDRASATPLRSPEALSLAPHPHSNGCGTRPPSTSRRPRKARAG